MMNYETNKPCNNNKKKTKRNQQDYRFRGFNTHRALCIADITMAAEVMMKPSGAIRKTSQLAYHNMLLAKCVRINCRAQGPSYHRVLELLNSLYSHGLGMYQLITQTECEQTG